MSIVPWIVGFFGFIFILIGIIIGFDRGTFTTIEWVLIGLGIIIIIIAIIWAIALPSKRRRPYIEMNTLPSCSPYTQPCPQPCPQPYIPCPQPCPPKCPQQLMYPLVNQAYNTSIVTRQNALTTGIL